MLPKFSVKNDIQAQHYVIVKLNKFGDKKPNDYGADTYWGNCHVDGVEHMWFISENMYKGITEAGFKEGDTFCVFKWKQGAKMGYNYLSPKDIQILNSTPMKEQEATHLSDEIEQTQPEAQNLVDTIHETKEFDKFYSPKAPADPYQVKMSRGAAYNLAFSFCLKVMNKIAAESNVEYLARLLETSESVAEKIAPFQQAFVNNENL